MSGNNALIEKIRKSLLSSGMEGATAAAASRAISSEIKTGTDRYSELLELWEDLQAEQRECM